MGVHDAGAGNCLFNPFLTIGWRGRNVYCYHHSGGSFRPSVTKDMQLLLHDLQWNRVDKVRGRKYKIISYSGTLDMDVIGLDVVLEEKMPEDVSILLADDNVQLLQMLKAFFSRNGFRCFSCSSGSEADTILQSIGDINLVLTDHNMPGNENLQMVRKIRELYPDIKVVVMSGGFSWKTQKELKDIGVCRYLQKPFCLSTLQAMINEEIMDQAVGE